MGISVRRWESQCRCFIHALARSHQRKQSALDLSPCHCSYSLMLNDPSSLLPLVGPLLTSWLLMLHNIFPEASVSLHAFRRGGGCFFQHSIQTTVSRQTEAPCYVEEGSRQIFWNSIWFQIGQFSAQSLVNAFLFSFLVFRVGLWQNITRVSVLHELEQSACSSSCYFFHIYKVRTHTPTHKHNEGWTLVLGWINVQPLLHPKCWPQLVPS